MTEKQHKAVWLTGFVILILFLLFVGITLGVPMIRLVRTPEEFRTWVDSFGILGKIIFVGMVFLQVLVALIPGEPVELAAGYAFGTAEGFILAMCGILLGSMTVFGLVRWLGIRFVTVFFPERDIYRLGFLNDRRKSFVLALILMTVPGTPKDLLSYVAGLTPLKLWQWILIVSLGRIPSVLTSVVTGAAAGEKNYLLAGGSFAITFAVSLGGILYYRKLCSDQT